MQCSAKAATPARVWRPGFFYDDNFSGLQLFIGMSLYRHKALWSRKTRRVHLIWILTYEASGFFIIGFFDGGPKLRHAPCARRGQNLSG